MEKTKRQAHRPLTIGAFAKSVGVGVETIRYYQRRGLLGTPSRASGAKRWYTEPMVARMAFIRRAQALGFTLAEIKELVAISAHNGSAGDLVRHKLAELDARIAELDGMRKELKRYVVMFDNAKPGDPCPFLRDLSASESPPAR